MSELTKFVGSVAATSTSVNFLIVVFLIEQYLSHESSSARVRKPFRNAALAMNAAVIFSVIALGALFAGYLLKGECIRLPIFGLIPVLDFGTGLGVIFVSLQLGVLVIGITWITLNKVK